MKPHVAILSLALLLSWLATPQARSAAFAPTDLPDLVEKVLPGVVNISSTTAVNYDVYGWQDFMRHWGIPEERKQTSLGSGFIIDRPEGYVLTNNHVVDRATEVMVVLMDKRQYRARIVGKDEKLDLALLQIRDKDRKVPTDISSVPLANSDLVRIAEPVFAVGNPFGLQHTVTTGIISAKNRTIGLGPFDNFLQTDATINPGNSGGPLFNLKGEVIGINTLIYSRAGAGNSLGFAIPINEAKKIVPELKRYGRVPRPWLGILGERVTPALASYYDLPLSKGVLLFNLVARGPADRAGIRIGDILTELDGTKLEEPGDVEKALFRHKPGEKAKLRIRRGGRTVETEIKLEELPPLANLPQGIM